MKQITGNFLNTIYKLGAAQSRYRVDGVWYHPLNKFPGALFDRQGYVLFDRPEDYYACRQVKQGPDPNHIHVEGGIASIPAYVRLQPPPAGLQLDQV